ncbi:glycosyltransferase family 39 protein [Prochlorococcus sp. AH-716-E13]|nr:glycosyltransferase family 39 protein [Prochlorococcus sp. AH-716-E13]
MWKINFKLFLKLLIFFPLIFYFGKRSYIAYDEGFYALQARWILEKGNWTIPLWWGNFNLDRTIGVQFLIAKSQEIFGENLFAAYLPTTISSIVMLIITYKLHEELIGRKFAIVSPLILSTTFLWFDYSHLATQDLIYCCFVTIGIFSIVKINSKKELAYIFLFGIWIGLAFMMKTFLVAIPITSLLPYLIKKKYIFTSKYFLLGLIIGFTPFILWATSINTLLDKNIIFHLLDKFKNLSKENTFTNPFYYYLWNIPVTFLPWSIFSIIGLVHGLKSKNSQGFILFYFPIIVIILISSFSTKTPYYPLQISSILSLNAFIGIKYLIEAKRFKFLFIFISSRIIPLFVFSVVLIYFFMFKTTLNLNIKENTFLIIGLILFALAWSFIKNTQSTSTLISILIIGPYLMTSCLLQSGLFTDRSRLLRETMEHVSSLKTINNRIIKVDKSSLINTVANSKIIRIALLTTNLGEGIENIKSLKTSELAWSIFPKEGQKNDASYKIIYENEVISPWKLIKKI